MRFGIIFWSKNNSDYKYDLVLVEKSYDDNKKGLESNFDIRTYNIEDLL